MEKYISYKEYQKICKEKNIKIDEEKLNEENDKFISQKLIEYKEYFDNIFTEVGEDIKLDEEQRKIILTDEDYCLINAGAGSGKSTTMAGKVKYLIDKLKVKPEEIIMLTFTKKSSEDLDEKVNDLLNLGIPVSTFHSLGMKFIKRYYAYPIQVVGEDEQKNIICNYIKELFKDKEKLKKLIDLFKENRKEMYISKGFIDNYSKFDTFEEYFIDYKKRKYKVENSLEGGIHQYIKNRIESEKSLYTIKGEKVKSKTEKEIANFLYINGIEYEYEKIYDEKVNEDTTYQPDFTIDYHGRKIYIEYFGLSDCYNEKNELNKRAVARYNRIRKIKENFQRNNKGEFINLDYINPDGNVIETLMKKLIDENIQFVRRTDNEIFNRILDNNLNAEFFKFTNLVISFIDRFKNMLVNDDDYMFEKRIKEISKENFKEHYYSINNSEEADSRINAIKYLKEIYQYYQKYLVENHMIDYSDMINLSYKYVIKEVKNKFPDLNYKYVIVDEYQDITFQRFLFTKALVEFFDAKLISVGDDWQSIYSFAGSRLELFNKFNELFLNAKDDMYLSTTYRFGQELVDVTSDFVLRNDEQSKKVIKSPKNLNKPIKFCEYESFCEEEKINELVHQLYEENPDYNILILARTNICLNKLSQSKFFSKGIGDVLICKDIPQAKIEILTMHRSKGLTSDQVIVFGLRDKVFPSQGGDRHWIFKYFQLDRIAEKFPFAEERRLFYVALTRTKNKVYLVVPKNRNQRSKFVNEIEKMLN